jgi:alpha-tubulin suppressor-like RCC1 family protein
VPLSSIHGKVTNVVAGHESTFIITDSGLLYGWGECTFGSEVWPVMIDDPVQVAAGHDQYYVMNSWGTINAWGSESLLGLGSESNDKIDVSAP